MKNFKQFILLLTASTLSLTACTTNDDSDEITFNNDYTNGILVLNEGGYGYNNASVTFYKNGITTQNIFKSANSTKTIGNVAQDLAIKDGKGYIVVNGSNKIEVVNASTFQSETTITSQLNNPRYIAIDDQNIYVSNWGDPSVSTDDYIAVFRKSDYAFVNKISVKEGPDQLLIKNNKLIIVHSGGWSNGNSVSIYNLSSNHLNNIIIGDVPNGIVENNGIAYILCTGITWNGTPSPGKIVKLNLETQTITQTINFKNDENPRFLAKENNQLYYTLNNNVYEINQQATTLPTAPLFATNATYIYSFNILNNAIYIGDAKDFNSNGEVKYYSLTGNLLGSFATGIGPNTILYNSL